MRMTRRVFLVGLVLFLASTQRADDFKFPLKSNSVRFAAIGDMGTGEKPEYETSAQMEEQHKTFPFEFVIALGDNIYGGHDAADLERKSPPPTRTCWTRGSHFMLRWATTTTPASSVFTNRST